MNAHTRRIAFAEFLGSLALVTIVVGSGIMGESLAAGNLALALLANALATGTGLFVLITLFSPISGAHLNPVVTGVMVLNGTLHRRDLVAYLGAQVTGALVGVVLAHSMFGLSLLQISHHPRAELRFYFSEGIATFGLILSILLTQKRSAALQAGTVSLYIVAAYWFTSSTSFANPAVTLARAFTDTFSGIGWNALPGFIGAQLAGALTASAVSRVFVPLSTSSTNQAKVTAPID